MSVLSDCITQQKEYKNLEETNKACSIPMWTENEKMRELFALLK